MKNFKLAVVAFIVLMSAASSSKAQKQLKLKAPKQVEQAVEALRKLMVDPDSAKLSAMASDKLTFGHSGGKIQNKQEFLHSFISGDTDFTSLEFTEQSITVSGSTAIVRHSLNGATADKGKAPGTVKLWIILVWQKVKGEWVLLARQAVKPPVA